jgi:hypothetical protein
MNRQLQPGAPGLLWQRPTLRPRNESSSNQPNLASARLPENALSIQVRTDGELHPNQTIGQASRPLGPARAPSSAGGEGVERVRSFRAKRVTLMIDSISLDSFRTTAPVRPGERSRISPRATPPLPFPRVLQPNLCVKRAMLTNMIDLLCDPRSSSLFQVSTPYVEDPASKIGNEGIGGKS